MGYPIRGDDTKSAALDGSRRDPPRMGWRRGQRRISTAASSFASLARDRARARRRHRRPAVPGARLRATWCRPGRAEAHHTLPLTGWVTFRLRTEHDVPGAVDLFRLNYERLRGTGCAHRHAPHPRQGDHAGRSRRRRPAGVAPTSRSDRGLRDATCRARARDASFARGNGMQMARDVQGTSPVSHVLRPRSPRLPLALEILLHSLALERPPSRAAARRNE